MKTYIKAGLAVLLLIALVIFAVSKETPPPFVEMEVKEVKIVDLKDHTYYAKLFLIVNKELIELDARPSDAIIMALKSKAPVYVAAKIVDDQGVLLTKKEALGDRHGIRVQELTPSLASHLHFH